MMSEQREKIRCRSCELMQWNDRVLSASLRDDVERGW